jgi:AcrR family transcriptional regulator
LPDKREKMDRFLEAAARAFTQNSYADVSIADLARDAGTATATVFAIFKSKDGVFDAALRGFVAKRLNGIAELDAAAPPVERLLN